MPIVEKGFDTWNEVKKRLDLRIIERDFFFHEREVWWCSLGVNIGVEANGKNENFERPVLIIKIFNTDMLWCLPITSTIKKPPFYYKFKFHDGGYYSVLVSQIRTISSKRLLRKIITLNEVDYQNIVRALNSIIKNETPTRGGGISEAEATNEISIMDVKRKSNKITYFKCRNCRNVIYWDLAFDMECKCGSLLIKKDEGFIRIIGETSTAQVI